MGNCASSTTGVEYTKPAKPASVIGSVGHLGSGNEDNVTVSSFGDEFESMQNNAQSVVTQNNVSESVAQEEAAYRDDRRGSLTPSIARSEEVDGAVVAGYAEPTVFRVLRRQNDQSSLEALEKAVRDDPNIKSTSLRVDNAPSRRPTALGVPNMQ